ncbi:FAD-dependent oxidoreductase [Robbsia sp. KACC 23696]|uniref:FAD-dependent oxidoreductase n=1 Tax=Robbsia sp. KACC 23696 TaxID=3149231 RepID=UPI00325BB870
MSTNIPRPGAVSDVAIAGAGLAGRLLAWRLARDGVRVALYERAAADDANSGSAAWVAASMLAPLTEAAVAEPLLASLGAASLQRWPEWLAQLPLPVFFQQSGSLVLWHPADRADADLFARRVRANAPAALLAGGMEAVDGAGIDALEPALRGRFRQGWWMPHEGQLDNRALLRALDQALDDVGVQRFHGVTIEDGRWPSAAVCVDCRGLGAKPAWRGLRGVRGEVVRVDAQAIALQRPIRFLHPRYPIYIAPKENGRFVIGATEIESDDASPMSVRSALELLSAAFAVHPAFGEARIAELNVQCRPTLDHHRPAITMRGTRVAINGLYRHGFMIGPEVVSQALALVHAMLARPDRIVDASAAQAVWSAQRAASPWPALFADAASSHYSDPVPR